MRILDVQPSSLRVTSNGFPDMAKVSAIRDGKLVPEPVYIVQNGWSKYIVRGHSESYAKLLKGYPVSVFLYENDSDVKDFQRGLARGKSTLTELVQACEAANYGSRELGIEMVADYTSPSVTKYFPLSA